MKCINCDAEVREGVVFCSSCGTRVPAYVEREHKANKKVKLRNKPKKVKQKKEKQPIGCLGIIVEFILIVILLCLLAIGITKGIEWHKNYKYDEFINKIISFGKNQDVKLSEGQRNEDWNSDGISNGDARDLNLNIAVKDSDGDGLSDYDEINVFHSNPLKYSTSDDIYSDGDKISLGYDINIRYETYKTIDVSSNLKLEVNDMYDMGAYYKDYTGAIPSGYYLGLQPFRVFSFNGEADLLIANPENFEVISYDTLTRRSQKIKSRVEDDYLVFDIKNDNPIFIVYKEEVLKNMSLNSIIKYPNEVINDYYVLEYPISTVFGGSTYIMEVDNYKAGNESDNNLVERLNKKYSDQNFKHIYINTTTAWILDKVVGNVVGESSSFSEKSIINYALVYGRVQGVDELEKLLDKGVSKSNNKNDGYDKAKKNKELIKQNEQYWDDFSSKNSNVVFNWYWNNIRRNQIFISNSTFNTLVSNLNSGKTVRAYLYSGDKNHIVEAYEMVNDPYDSELLYIKVHDSNFSNGMFWDYEENYVGQDVFITLKKQYVKTWHGIEVRYVYDYNPLGRDTYHFSSFDGGLDGIAFVLENGYAF